LRQKIVQHEQLLRRRGREDNLAFIERTKVKFCCCWR